MAKLRTFKVESPFFGNFFIVNKQKKHLFVSISKCGCSSLKQFAAEENQLIDREIVDSEDIHKIFGSRASEGKLAPLDASGFEDYLRVAIWRDPVKRFLSWYDNKVVEQKPPYTQYTALAVQPDLDRAIELLEFELGKSDPLWMDEHLRPQADYYKPDQVELVVDLADMNDYLRSIGTKVTAKVNKATRKKKTVPSQEQRNRIVAAYARDYTLLEQIKPLLWQPIEFNAKLVQFTAAAEPKSKVAS